MAYPKFGLTPDDQVELLGDYFPVCEIVEPSESCPQLCRDKQDQPFLDLAHCGRADVLVSGDHDLLALAGHTSFSIESHEAYRIRVGNV